MSSEQCKYTSKRAARAIERILGALKADCLTTKQLAAKACLSKNSVQKYLAYLQQEPRRVRIHCYEPGVGPTAPMYGLGSAPDAKRRKKRTASARFKALKAEPEKYQKSLAMRRLSRLRASVAKRPRTPWSALFVVAKQGRAEA